MENCLHLIKNILSESNKSKIAIIGKGKSVKDIDLDLLNDFFIININDSEKIIPGDVSLFFRTDMYDHIRKNGFKSKFYAAPYFLKIPDDKHLEVRHQSLNQDSYEHTYDYFADEEFYLVDFIILSAIKLAIEFQKVQNKKLDVYLIGFDFHTDIVTNESNQVYDLEYINVLFKTQESFFTSLLKNFSETYPDIALIHVGEKSYSKYSTKTFNNFLAKNKRNLSNEVLPTNTELYLKLLSEVKETGKVIVVAEFTNNHIADPERLLKMIDLACESGADMIKFQKRDVDTFYTEEELSKPYDSPFGKTLGDYRKGVELTTDMFNLIDEECRKRKIPWFTSVLDWNSYEYILQFDSPIIKLPSTISNHKNYLLKVGADFKGDLVISTGFTDASYEQFILDNFTDNRSLFMLQCTSSYPTPPEACQVSVVRHYDEIATSKYINVIPGYSSHDVGSLGCMLAVAAGAKMLEKHVKLGDLDWIHFDGVAIDLYNNKFKEFVNDVRKAEIICGSKQKKIHKQENHKYNVNEKSN
jgi:sialic acid synthase SpsE